MLSLYIFPIDLPTKINSFFLILQNFSFFFKQPISGNQSHVNENISISLTFYLESIGWNLGCNCGLDVTPGLGTPYAKKEKKKKDTIERASSTVISTDSVMLILMVGD